MKFEELITLANDFSESPKTIQEFSNILVSLYSFNDTRSLDAVSNLASSDYGGITFKAEFQTIACLAMLHWGAEGISALEKVVIETQGYRMLLNSTTLLAHISSKSLTEFPAAFKKLECIEQLDLGSEKYKTDLLTLRAKEALINIAKSVEKDEAFPIGLTNHFSFTTNERVQEHLFASLMARWFNLSSFGIHGFNNLINRTDATEIDCHNYIKTNPYILEPFHAQIWSKPRFGEHFVPDFLIRAMDNSYTIVEIENPEFSIMTAGGELSAKSTHAKRQALDFRDWAIDNHLYACRQFQGIYRPFCLVVTGMERSLNQMQRQRLLQENESTQGILRIVGFDWLYLRARAVFDNLITFGFDKHVVNSVISS
jgi:Domain of unknown function (DUF4263)